MKRKIPYADLDELNGEPIGKPGAPVNLVFLPSPEQVHRSIKPIKVTVELEPTSLDYYRREAKRRGETPAKIMRRILRAHAIAEA
ncbi:MAG: CopG family transcriptional regulator [Verrucomicrobiota bacterium]|nr:CopG family transcriptional regulator [Verrucomicrobiota bacterium]